MMMFLHILHRRVGNFKDLFRQLHLSVKFLADDGSLSSMSSNSSDSSDSSNSDSDNETSIYEKNNNAEAKNNDLTNYNTVENLNRILDSITKKVTDNNSKESKIRYLAKKVQFKEPHLENNYNNNLLEKELKNAIKNISKGMGDESDKVELELLSKIKTQSKTSFNDYKKDFINQDESSNLSNILSNMKVVKQKRDNYNEKKRRIPRTSVNNLPENSFPKISLNSCIEEHVKFLNNLPVTKAQCISELQTWNMLQKRELKLLVVSTPQNAFQEMIEWTEKGILWRFPINNEQDMVEEQNVHFSEHIFLERHLKDWCPNKGPLRHFMELVCTGLSKNPYMSVNEKIGHIMWYKNYFEDKKEMLEEVPVLETNTTSFASKKINLIET